MHGGTVKERNRMARRRKNAHVDGRGGYMRGGKRHPVHNPDQLRRSEGMVLGKGRGARGAMSSDLQGEAEGLTIAVMR